MYCMRLDYIILFIIKQDSRLEDTHTFHVHLSINLLLKMRVKINEMVKTNYKSASVYCILVLLEVVVFILIASCDHLNVA